MRATSQRIQRIQMRFYIMNHRINLLCTRTLAMAPVTYLYSVHTGPSLVFLVRDLVLEQLLHRPLVRGLRVNSREGTLSVIALPNLLVQILLPVVEHIIEFFWLEEGIRVKKRCALHSVDEVLHLPHGGHRSVLIWAALTHRP